MQNTDELMTKSRASIHACYILSKRVVSVYTHLHVFAQQTETLKQDMWQPAAGVAQTAGALLEPYCRSSLAHLRTLFGDWCPRSAVPVLVPQRYAGCIHMYRHPPRRRIYPTKSIN